ncbi:MAG: hypothetical protein Gaeavirus12_12 [Gaeavirus sp.]|uniref:Uncharacterized protein n=1 Tax=Gaeavirus sp. TaxID=2487767 RepID=A0A3G5A0Y1_9VIRU|nr:MAG: hypothetical protein Gaeavirus12_12 [Gaeavirus sp.]
MSSSLNYCLVKQNNIYEELYDILSDEDLIMDNPNHKESIKLNEFITNYLFIFIILYNVSSVSCPKKNKIRHQ